MDKHLISVGLDVGTTTTQLIVSRLEIKNNASGFAVPEMTIAHREILYKSPVHFTPLLSGELVDGSAIREIVAKEYEKAGIARQQVDTGAIIITGETSRKENAAAVLEKLADFAGDFVVATAGPDLESVLAAKGAGAAEYSKQTGKTVVHIDIGGGTSNLCRIENGEIVATACLNVGGRLIKIDARQKISYISPVVKALSALQLGQTVQPDDLQPLAQLLTQALEMAVCLRPRTQLLQQLTTTGSSPIWEQLPKDTVLSFSGGVADCIEGNTPGFAYGDMGPILGKAIRQSSLCAGEYRLGRHTIRATVIGAGCHSAQLSGSTVYTKNIRFPIKNLPVARPHELSEEAIRAAIARQDGPFILALPIAHTPDYPTLSRLGELLCQVLPKNRLYLAMEADMAKALGQKLALQLPEAEILSLDRLSLQEGSFLDVGQPVGPALPVVIKTLLLSRQ